MSQPTMLHDLDIISLKFTIEAHFPDLIGEDRFRVVEIGCGADLEQELLVVGEFVEGFHVGGFSGILHQRCFHLS